MERVRFAGGTVVSKEQEKGAYTIETENKIGEVRIADEVVAVIAGLAATEVEGVASMAGNMTRELISKLEFSPTGSKVNVVLSALISSAGITHLPLYFIVKLPLHPKLAFGVLTV